MRGFGSEGVSEGTPFWAQKWSKKGSKTGVLGPFPVINTSEMGQKGVKKGSKYPYFGHFPGSGQIPGPRSSCVNTNPAHF